MTPVVYYLDPGIPEPYRTAFLQGGNWWNTVFEAAGWKNGFQVKELPDLVLVELCREDWD